MIDLATHNIWIASQIYNIQRDYYNDNELTMMYYLIKLVVSLQIMDGRNDKAANNRYGLRNREHSNHNGGLSISGEGSGGKEEDKEEEDVGNSPHQRRRVDDANNEDPGEMLDVPRVIDFDGNSEQLLNP